MSQPESRPWQVVVQDHLAPVVQDGQLQRRLRIQGNINVVPPRALDPEASSAYAIIVNHQQLVSATSNPFTATTRVAYPHGPPTPPGRTSANRRALLYLIRSWLGPQDCDVCFLWRLSARLTTRLFAAYLRFRRGLVQTRRPGARPAVGSSQQRTSFSGESSTRIRDKLTVVSLFSAIAEHLPFFHIPQGNLRMFA